MKTVSLSGSLRENVGKKDAKALRKSELVPCVLYGGDEQIHFATEAKNFKKILFTPETFIINITIGDKSYDAILQDVQYHPVTDNVLHADFLLVKEDKPITVVLPLAIEGSAPGVLRGGKLKQAIRKIKVCGLAKDLPEQICTPSPLFRRKTVIFKYEFLTCKPLLSKTVHPGLVRQVIQHSLLLVHICLHKTV